MTERATLAELHEFANAVREAGGGNPIDALMPAVPQDTSQCLNFNCEVMGADDYGVEDEDAWVMATHDRELRNRIAKALHLRKLNIQRRSADDQPDYAVLLPKRIGKVADDFDRAGEVLHGIGYVLSTYAGTDHFEDGLNYEIQRFSRSQRALALEMAPYIEESEREARKLATLVNPGGEASVLYKTWTKHVPVDVQEYIEHLERKVGVS